ncbi:hypothetical protein TrRE_jg6107 [Triparma retinervis]|uniref:Uncharacterized protein n=1 Tax=Triparma retinervis TaxID=2557542 RepID=A0A9W7E595_9STRA|nr:hypothetical protein TrRE_jg6107 [Triparma retinervis]
MIPAISSAFPPLVATSSFGTLDLWLGFLTSPKPPKAPCEPGGGEGEGQSAVKADLIIQLWELEAGSNSLTQARRVV